jgi:hypothetical protein
MFFLKKVLSFIILLFISSTFAQKSTINGVVFDNLNSQPVEYASIVLLNQNDNSVIAGELAKKMELFRLIKYKGVFIKSKFTL